MKNLKRYFNWRDLCLILGLFLCSFLPLLFLRQPASQSTVAVIKVRGQELQRFDLTSSTTETYQYYSENGEMNLIEINHQRVRIKEANCRDHICEAGGWIDQPGQTIVCLPHQLVIEIQTGGDGHGSIY
ncbi:NusG domain II-containing protein [Enterococcus hailinensis]|uniref:NusG domain II-containing protein n=1 Tax=Enterococcus hailinensis TaxID=3238988 RepID=UPI0038B35D0A